MRACGVEAIRGSEKFPEPVLPFAILAPESVRISKHINSCRVSHWVWETLNRQFSNEVRTNVFPERPRRRSSRAH